MTKCVPANAFLDSDLLGNWSNIFAQNCLSPEWMSPSVPSARKNPVVRPYVSRLFSPRQKCIGNERMDGYGLLRRFRLARANDTVNDGSRYVHRSLREVDVAPFQTEQLILPQAGGYCQEDQCSFSDAEIVDQPLDFSGHQDSWCSAPLRT